MPGHGAGLDASGKAVAHDEVRAFTPFGDELGHLREVVAVITVSHDDKIALRGFDSGAERVAVSLGGNVDHAGAMLLRDFDGAVRGTVVGDDDLAANFGFREGCQSLVDT